MKQVKAFFDFYISSSIHVALAVVSLCVVSFLVFKVPVDYTLLCFVFFGSVTGYNFVKYAGVAKLHHRSLAKSLKAIQVFSLLVFLFFVITSFFVEFEVLLWGGFFGLFTLLYALPVFKNQKNLRSISGLKIFIIAWVWAGVTLALPLSGEFPLFSEEVGLAFLQRFLLILVWILPFEIRDLKYDLRQLGTLPQRMGITRTKLFGLFLLLAVVLLELFKVHSSGTSVGALAFTVSLSAILVWKARDRQSRYYASFWVESLPIAWMLALLFLRYF